LKEYRVVYYNAETYKVDATIVPEFQNIINRLATEGWLVKFSNITSIPEGEVQSAPTISAYALLERDVK
jgi:hypothetical protein